MRSPLSPVEALVFDFDGLMVDTERVHADCVIEVLADWGVQVGYADFGHLFGSVDADEQWNVLLGSWCGRTVTDLDARLHTVTGPLKDALPLLPGVVELLDHSRRAGLRLGLATGNSLAAVERHLSRHGVFDRFDAVITRTDVQAGKPAPDIYIEVSERLGVPAASCVVLEDSVHGCQAALAAGMRVIACPTAVTAHCEYPADAVRVASLVDVSLDGLPPMGRCR